MRSCSMSSSDRGLVMTSANRLRLPAAIDAGATAGPRRLTDVLPARCWPLARSLDNAGVEPPPAAALRDFGVSGATPHALSGGQGTAWRADDLVLKPSTDPEADAWV